LQQQEKLSKLVEWFAKAAVRHAKAVEAMQEEAASAQVEDLNRYYAALKHEEGGVERLLVLLDHEDDAVSGMAAVYAIREETERCIAVLARIAKRPGLIGFRAQTALDRWQSGQWPR
jgi:hypothetical protein